MHGPAARLTTRLATWPWRAMRRLSARLPLRVKLITAALALVAVALAVISSASVAVFHTYLLHRADQQLEDYAKRALLRGDRYGFLAGVLTTRGLAGYMVQVRDADGKPVTAPRADAQQPSRPLDPGTAADSGPAIPARPGWLSAHSGHLVTVPDRSGDGVWRVAVEPIHYTVQPLFPPGPNVTGQNQPGLPGYFIAGVNLGSIGQTINTLTLIDLTVSGIVIVILAGVGVTVVRTSLRPLAEIERTAGAIATGDLSRRVPASDPRTEIGSLAQSFNAMLGQIETAFHARSVSEATARQSEERMRRFVADASHELRTPLSVIRGFAEYYRQRGGLKEDELDRMIKRVEDEAARMGLLVEDLLLLARLDQQRPLQQRPVDLLALAADAAQDARVLAPRRDIQLGVGSGGPFLVIGDEARLRQVIGNLVSNALTHTPDGTPVEIRLTCGVLPGPAGHEETAAAGLPAVLLDVTDFGPGLPPEQAERVFERFYRADAARTRKTGGSGLGLAIVAALTAAHGGTASVDTAPGKGAIFRITLPLAPDAAGITPPVPASPGHV